MAVTPKMYRNLRKRQIRQGWTWRSVGFVFGSWIECTRCGAHARSQNHMDTHAHGR